MPPDRGAFSHQRNNLGRANDSRERIASENAGVVSFSSTMLSIAVEHRAFLVAGYYQHGLFLWNRRAHHVADGGPLVSLIATRFSGLRGVWIDHPETLDLQFLPRGPGGGKNRTVLEARSTHRQDAASHSFALLYKMES
jgi:hypothetical protein